MKKRFASLHARAFSHATENLDKVKRAMENVLGETELKVSRTEGTHGNPITVLEASIEDSDEISCLFGRMSEDDLARLLTTMRNRIDNGCNLFIRIDKQEAYKGGVRLATNDDVISIRLRVLAFPARCEVASEIAKDYIEAELERRKVS